MHPEGKCRHQSNPGKKGKTGPTRQAVLSLRPLLPVSDPLRSLPQWHNLSREEQAKYYELARKERQLHSQLYPTWSARDNYVSAAQTPGQHRLAEGGGKLTTRTEDSYGLGMPVFL